jgi:hypothetical protein
MKRADAPENIYNDGELEQNRTTKDLFVVRTEGKR